MCPCIVSMCIVSLSSTKLNYHVYKASIANDYVIINRHGHPPARPHIRTHMRVRWPNTNGILVNCFDKKQLVMTTSGLYKSSTTESIDAFSSTERELVFTMDFKSIVFNCKNFWSCGSSNKMVMCPWNTEIKENAGDATLSFVQHM